MTQASSEDLWTTVLGYEDSARLKLDIQVKAHTNVNSQTQWRGPL